MKSSLKTARFVFLVAALTGAVWLPSRDAAAEWCQYWCDDDPTVIYSGATSFSQCRYDAYSTCIPRGVGGTFCYGMCQSW